jgi:hypothetical protein
MNELVQKLCEGDHRVEVSLRPDKTSKAFMDCINRKYVHVKFTETKGGTELGMKLDSQATDLRNADFQKETGTVKLVGDLTLDYSKVRLFATIELPTLTGTGHLELAE